MQHAAAAASLPAPQPASGGLRGQWPSINGRAITSAFNKCQCECSISLHISLRPRHTIQPAVRAPLRMLAGV